MTFLLATATSAAGMEVSACASGAPGGRVIAVSGARLASLHGARPGDLRVWSIRDGAPVAVPFQVDECEADGRVILSRTEDPRVFGRRSVLLVRRADAGERSIRVGAEGAEIEIAPRAGGDSSWLYVGRPHDIGISDRDDVDYDPDADRIHATRYTLGFDHPQVAYFAIADGKGNDRGNLLDRLKARVRAHFLWGLISFRRTEEDIGEEVIGYRDGRIRVVRRARLRVEIGWGVPSPEIIADDYYYADHAEGPIYISLPFPLAYVFGDLDVQLYLDFRALDGFEVLAEGVDPGLVRVGSGTILGRSEPGPPTSWFLLVGPDAAMLHRLRFGPTLEGLDSRLVYVDAPSRRDPPESVVGMRPGIGYRLQGWASVGRGRHEVWMDTYVVDPTDAADPRGVLDGVSIAPRIKVSPVGSGRPSAGRAS